MAYDAVSDSMSINWKNDVPGYNNEHTTRISVADLRQITQSGSHPECPEDFFQPPSLWTKEPLDLPDYDYESYMQDNQTVYKLMNQLQTAGIAFVTNSPGIEESVSAIAKRIGPCKDTFYGYTWDGKHSSPS